MSIRCRIASGTRTIRIGEEIRLEFRRFHATGEIGGTVFKDDQQVFESSTVNPGNRETPFLGQRLFLTNLQQSYGVRGSGAFTKVLFTSNALTWLDLYGQFLYSRPETDTNYQQFNTGNFAISSAALFVTIQQFSLISQARMPHTAGSAGAEIRPFNRTRILVSWLTDRLENTGTSTFNSMLRNNYSQSDVDLIVEPDPAGDAPGRLSLCLGRRANRRHAAGRTARSGDGRTSPPHRQRRIHLPARGTGVDQRRYRSACQRPRLFPHESERLPAECASAARYQALNTLTFSWRSGAAQQPKSSGRHQL